MINFVKGNVYMYKKNKTDRKVIEKGFVIATFWNYNKKNNRTGFYGIYLYCVELQEK